MLSELVDELYVEYDDKKSLVQNSYCGVLYALSNCENREGPIEWDWDHNDMSDLMEQVGIFFETCGEFHTAYCALRRKYWELGEEQGGDFSNLLYEEELQQLGWVDFPVMEEFDLDSLYDRIRNMLNFRIFHLGRRNLLLEFLEMATSNE